MSHTDRSVRVWVDVASHYGNEGGGEAWWRVLGERRDVTSAVKPTWPSSCTLFHLLPSLLLFSYFISTLFLAPYEMCLLNGKGEAKKKITAIWCQKQEISDVFLSSPHLIFCSWSLWVKERMRWWQQGRTWQNVRPPNGADVTRGSNGTKWEKSKEEKKKKWEKKKNPRHNKMNAAKHVKVSSIK